MLNALKNYIKKKFVLGAILFVIVFRLLEWINFPIPFFRLILIAMAAIGLFFCYRWSGAIKRRKDTTFFLWLLRASIFLLIVIIIAGLSGKQWLAYHLFISSILTIIVMIAFFILSFVIRGLLVWLFGHAFFRRGRLPDKDSDALVVRAEIFIDVIIAALLIIPGILKIWKVYDTIWEATKGFFSFGFTLGSQQISIGVVFISLYILYTAFFISWILQIILADYLLMKRQIGSGVRHAMSRLMHYIIVFIGLILSLSALGLDFTELTIIISALGVGIGFGLQSVVNNFISGIILLFERPVRVGDIVEMNGRMALIKRIGLRSTTVTTFDESDVIMPNAGIINNEVINWTLSSRSIRVIIPVGVAYGSDVDLVMKTLKECATENSKVAKSPEPQVLFLRFGESSLDFELRFWILNIDEKLITTSTIHEEIDQRFRKAKIEISFPQRDLHLRSIGNTAILKHSECIP